MAGKHRVRITGRRGAIGVVAAGVLLAATSGISMASVGTTAPGPVDISCADAINTYNAARAETAKARLADASAQDTQVAAKTQAQAEYTAAVSSAPADDPKTDVDEHAAAIDAAQQTRDAKISAADRAYTDGGTAGKMADAQAAQDARGKEADTACKGEPGVDARVVLSPDVCARVLVRPASPQRLIKVVALIPCPPAVPPAPPVPPKTGDPVVTYVPSVQASLPVTH